MKQMRDTCMRVLVATLSLALALPAMGQFSYPASASTRLYLGHFIDGGPEAQKWKTTVIFTNPSATIAAPVKVSFYDDAGQPLALDFGQGASPTLTLTVPAGGTKLLTTAGASPTLLQGWGTVESPDNPAMAPATPVVASVLYRGEISGNRYWDVATIGSGSTFFYSSYANRDLGVALANPSRTQSIRLQISARSETGQAPGGPWMVPIPPLGHLSFNLYDSPTNLDSFSGTIQISSADDPPSPFVALTLNYRDPVLSPLPPGETASPSPSDRRPYDVAIKVRQAGVAALGETDPFKLSHSPSEIAEFVGAIGVALDPDVPLRAYYNSSDKSVHLSAGMIEALGTNDAALAFVIAYMHARGVFQSFGMPPAGVFASDPEGLADFYAMITLLKGGFDPGGAGDLFNRLMYAASQGLTVDAALRNGFAIPSGVPPRLQKIADSVKAACGDTAAMGQICATARRYWHPHNPTNVP